MVAKNSEGDNIAVPGLIIENQDDIRRFAKSIKRIEMRHQQKKEFHELDFNSKAYVDQLANYNVNINLKRSNDI